MNVQYRQEKKYKIAFAEKELLIRRLSAALQVDPHALPQGRYSVRTLYLDDVNDSAMQDTVTGAPEKIKYRIRMYNGDPSYIRLEKKVKQYGGGFKVGEVITQAECQRILAEDYAFLRESDSAFLQECYAVSVGGGLRPKLIVQYDRYAFVCPQDDVRITIDTDIRVCRIPHAFFDAQDLGTSVMPNRECILEIKYNHFLPDYVPLLVGIQNRPLTAMSKFSAGRLYY